LKAQVNERSDAFYNKFKELISIQYCTFIKLSVMHGGGWELLFFRIHVKGVIEFFCDAGGWAGHFVPDLEFDIKTFGKDNMGKCKDVVHLTQWN
jgi:hypothetical protein